MKRVMKDKYKIFYRNNNQLEKKIRFFDSDKYDIGDAIQIIEEISNIIRKIIDGKNGLFYQLGYSSYCVFPNYQTNEMGSNMMKEHKLVSMFFSNITSGYKSGMKISAQWFSDLNCWWNEIVINDKDNSLVTRRDIVKVIADKEGGAHYDKTYNEDYFKLCIENNENAENYELIYKNIYFCSLLTIAKEYLYAVNLLNKIIRSTAGNEIIENEVSFMRRDYHKQSKIPKYQFNIIDENKEFATRVHLMMEKNYNCGHYLYKSYLRNYIDSLTGERFQIRFLNTKQNIEELLYVIDINKSIIALGRMKEKNRFILFNASTVVKRESEKSLELISEGKIIEEEFNYRTEVNIEFERKKDALDFIAGQYKETVNWGTYNKYDSSKSVKMQGKISKLLRKLDDSVINLFYEVKALCKKNRYEFKFKVISPGEQNGFIANHHFDINNNIIEIVVNEDKADSVTVSKVLLYAKLKLKGYPQFVVKKNSESIYYDLGSKTETFLLNV